MQADENQHELDGWDEIAAYLRVGRRTAQNYERAYGLPVHRKPGSKGRVYANRVEIDRWRVQKPAADPPAGPAAGKQLHWLSAAPFATRFSRPKARLLVLLIAGLTAATLVIGRLRPHNRPVAYRVNVATLVTLDAQGREVWRYVFPKPLSELEFGTPEKRRQNGAFADVDGDGQTEMVFNPVPAAGQSHEVVCFSYTGRIKWRFTPGRPKIPGPAGDYYFPPYTVGPIEIIREPGQRGAFTIITGLHHLDAPAQLAALDGAGKLVGEYWHPGHLNHLGQGPLGRDGRTYLFAGGVNNGEHSATVVVFDPVNVHGSPRDLSDSRFALLGFPPGTEKAVILFPRTCVSKAKGSPYNRVWAMNFFGGNLSVVVAEDIDMHSSDYLIYNFDRDLNIVDVVPSVELQATHRRLEKTGDINHPFSVADVRQWKSAVIVKRGR